jgi:hypothetical protein
MLLRIRTNGLSCEKQNNGEGKEEAQIRKEMMINIPVKRDRDLNSP